jgi:hypothetical protein
LSIIASWLRETTDCNIYVDLPTWPSPSSIVEHDRPDIIAITSSGHIRAIELTICFETNVLAAARRKQSKYENLRSIENQPIELTTIEVTTLGFTCMYNLTSLIKDLSGKVIPPPMRQF